MTRSTLCLILLIKGFTSRSGLAVKIFMIRFSAFDIKASLLACKALSLVSLVYASVSAFMMGVKLFIIR